MIYLHAIDFMRHLAQVARYKKVPAALRLGLISTKRGYQPYPAQCSRVPLLAAVTRSPPAFSATAIAPPLLALLPFHLRAPVLR